MARVLSPAAGAAVAAVEEAVLRRGLSPQRMALITGSRQHVASMQHALESKWSLARGPALVLRDEEFVSFMYDLLWRHGGSSIVGSRRTLTTAWLARQQLLAAALTNVQVSYYKPATEPYRHIPGLLRVLEEMSWEAAYRLLRDGGAGKDVAVDVDHWSLLPSSEHGEELREVYRVWQRYKARAGVQEAVDVALGVARMSAALPYGAQIGWPVDHVLIAPAHSVHPFTLRALARLVAPVQEAPGRVVLQAEPLLADGWSSATPLLDTGGSTRMDVDMTTSKGATPRVSVYVDDASPWQALVAPPSVAPKPRKGKSGTVASGDAPATISVLPPPPPPPPPPAELVVTCTAGETMAPCTLTAAGGPWDSKLVMRRPDGGTHSSAADVATASWMLLPADPLLRIAQAQASSAFIDDVDAPWAYVQARCMHSNPACAPESAHAQHWLMDVGVRPRAAAAMAPNDVPHAVPSWALDCAAALAPLLSMNVQHIPPPLAPAARLLQDAQRVVIACRSAAAAVQLVQALQSVVTACGASGTGASAMHAIPIHIDAAARLGDVPEVRTLLAALAVVGGLDVEVRFMQLLQAPPYACSWEHAASVVRSGLQLQQQQQQQQWNEQPYESGASLLPWLPNAVAAVAHACKLPDEVQAAVLRACRDLQTARGALQESSSCAAAAAAFLECSGIAADLQSVRAETGAPCHSSDVSNAAMTRMLHMCMTADATASSRNATHEVGSAPVAKSTSSRLQSLFASVYSSGATFSSALQPDMEDADALASDSGAEEDAAASDAGVDVLSHVSEGRHVIVTTLRRAPRFYADVLVCVGVQDSAMPGPSRSPDIACPVATPATAAAGDMYIPTSDSSNDSIREAHLSKQRAAFHTLLGASSRGTLFFSIAQHAQACVPARRRTRFLNTLLGSEPLLSGRPPAASPHETALLTAREAEGNRSSSGNSVRDISFTRYLEYAMCPYRFYLARRIGVPQSPSAAMQYGKALHEAIAVCGMHMHAALSRVNAHVFAQAANDDGIASSSSNSSSSSSETNESSSAEVTMHDRFARVSAWLLDRVHVRDVEWIDALLATLPDEELLVYDMMEAYHTTWMQTVDNPRVPAAVLQPLHSARNVSAPNAQPKVTPVDATDAAVTAAVSRVSRVTSSVLISLPPAAQSAIHAEAERAVRRFARAELANVRESLQRLRRRLQPDVATVVDANTTNASITSLQDTASMGAARAAEDASLQLSVPVLVEHPFRVLLPDGRTSLIGVLDRVDVVLHAPLTAVHDTPAPAACAPAWHVTARIREFKSGVQWKAGGALARMTDNSKQVSVYALALFHMCKPASAVDDAAHAHSASEVATYELVQHEASMESIETGQRVLRTIGRRTRLDAQASLIACAGAIEHGDFAATPSPVSCKLCPFRTLCPQAYGLLPPVAGVGASATAAAKCVSDELNAPPHVLA